MNTFLNFDCLCGHIIVFEYNYVPRLKLVFHTQQLFDE